MAFDDLRSNAKKATSKTPQVAIIVIDDSGSMEGDAARQASEGAQQLVMEMQANNLGAGGSRFILSLAKFGDTVAPICVAAKPDAVDMTALTFTGDSGTTEMAAALNWAADAVEQSLAVCRRIPGYSESASPSPIVVFFSDGANTGGDVTPAVTRLHAIPFQSGRVNVVAVGIGMAPTDFQIMKTIASDPDLARNINPAELQQFIAFAGATIIKGETPKTMVDQFGAV